ncbi:hypothetical protein ABZ650_12595 [Streptomyces griseoviridis]|uniref:hypothetical protein n=1 Tax=Streptomyces griseoviridis TaxID=45398 RepID=UPI00340ECF77
MTLRWLTSYPFVAKARTTPGQDADVHQQPRKTDAKKTAKPPAKKTAPKRAAR